MMDMEQVEAGPVMVLRLHGALEDGGVDTLRTALTNCLQARRACVVVNLDDVAVVSYLGLGVLVERLRLFRKSGGDLKLARPSLHVKRLMRLAAVLHLFDICESEAHAVEAFREAA
jgi:anti-sigma B factor antagonist